MRKVLGFIIVVLLLSWSVAVVRPVRATSVNGDEAVYDAFWDILNREAELYAQVVNGNSSAVPELISNSRLGAENAVNISTLIWNSIEELKASGVKTYYTADELRAMAENISKNGLPDETVEELREQGWTDEQIEALEEYIAKNADNITDDFNMTAFLQNFSTAFMRVAFKYNHYWAYGLEKLLNENSSSLDVPMVIITEGSNFTEVPLAWDEFVDFNASYNTANLTGKLALVKKLEESVLKMANYSEWRTVYSRRNVIRGNSSSCPLIGDPRLLEIMVKNSSTRFNRLFNKTFVVFDQLPKGAAGYYSETVKVRSFVSGAYIIITLSSRFGSGGVPGRFSRIARFKPLPARITQFITGGRLRPSNHSETLS